MIMTYLLNVLVENYFNPKQNISMTPLEMIASMASESVKLEKRISDLESRIDDVQTNAIKSTLEHGSNSIHCKYRHRWQLSFWDARKQA